MSQKRRLVSKLEGDFFTRFGLQIRLIVRLMGDPRVNLFLKALPVFSLLYLISPLDIVIPLVDDAFILWLANTLFLELCPQAVVEEHRANLEREVRPKKEGQPPIDEQDVIEARYRDKSK
ncbi:MAG: YkvA family protein [Anaerolineales bacterium]